MNKKNIDSPKIGILYDSYHKNTGDRAMGLVMGELLRSYGIDYIELNPFQKDKSIFDLIITGGGQIIRNPGNFYYDNFRIWGPHILNAVELTDFNDVEFLKTYEYISVRSSATAKKLQQKGVNAICVPDICISMTNKDSGVNLPANTVGVHFMPVVGQEKLSEHVTFVKKIAKDHTVVLIPITHYSKDYSYLKKIHSLVPETIILKEHNPQVIFDTIASFKIFITMSLHAAIFAYTQKVNFLVWDEPLNRKMYEFFKDRQLDDRLFVDYKTLLIKFNYFLLNDTIDYKKQLTRDKSLLKRHFDKIIELVKNTNTNWPEKVLYSHLTNLEKKNTKLLINLQYQDDKLLLANSKIKLMTKELTDIKKTKSWRVIKKLNKYRGLIK